MIGKSKKPRIGLPRNVWVLTVGSFLTDISSEMVFNLLPLFLVNVLGTQTGTVGFIEGIAATTSSLLKIVSGWVSDQIGSRKWLTVAGYTISAVAKPFLYIVVNWSGVLAVRFADRTGKGIRTSPRDALIADSVSETGRGRAFGLHRAGDTAGAAIGLAIAFVVVWSTQEQDVLLAESVFRTLVLLSIVPASLAVLVLAIGAREIPAIKKDITSSSKRKARGFDRRFWHFLLVMILFTLGNSSDAFIILRAQERGLSVLGVLGMLFTLNIVYALVSGPAGALSDRLGRRTLIVCGWITYAIVYLGLGLSQTAWHVWLLFGLYGLYYGLAEGAGRALVADLVESEKRGQAYGIYNATVGLALLPASLIAGWLWQGIGGWQGLGAAAPFFTGAALALAATILLLALDFPDLSANHA